MTKKADRLYLVDGSALFYRAYFAFFRNPLINSKGENTSATFGFVNSLLKLIKEEQPEYIAVIFDTKEPTFRHKKYPEYKSTRAKMPDELVEQLPRIKEATNALRIASYELPGYEADDIIGTFATKASEMGLDVWCVTGDKDFFQLVTEKIKIYNPKKASEPPYMMGPHEVEMKFGVPPELVIDKLALMGDSSDNVPGIPGIGAKTADKLLAQFGSVKKIIEKQSEIEAKGVREKVSKNSDMALLSRELVTIDINSPIEFKPEQMRRQQFDFDASRKLFLELEFTNLLKQLLPESDILESKNAIVPKSDNPVFYHTVENLADLKRLISKLSKAKEISIDTETTSINSHTAKLVGISITEQAGSGYYIPLGHTTDADTNLPLKDSLAVIKKLLENSKVQKIGQNIKYDLEVLHRYNIDIEPVSFDTMLASYVLNPSVRQHSLDAQTIKYFGYQMQPISDLIGKGKSQTTFDTVPISKAVDYAVEDSDYTFRLRMVHAPEIDKLELQQLYYDIELPLIKVLAGMEEAGVKVDIGFLDKLSKKMERELNKIEKEIHGIAGGEFNINSTRQLSHILFEKLNLPTKGKTAKKTGYSTNVKVLEELAKIHPFPKLILHYRQLTKLKSTYIDAIPRLINPNTGRVHTSFNQTIAATGRLSSTAPNLQNIPVRTDEGREIRKAFIPRNGDYLFLTADYSQIELRILAHYSNDESLIKAFKAGEDIHSRTAAEVYNVSLDKVTPDMRRAAKTANFAIIYGVSAFGLSQQTELNLGESKDFIDRYFARYPGIKRYMDETIDFAKANGYVTTMFNRRRYLPEINDKRFNIRQFAERTAINTPIQGTAADIIKIAMINIYDKILSLKTEMILQVHDELIFDVYKKELEEVKEIVQNGMEKVVKLKVPLIADIGVGVNWLEAK